MNWTIFDYGVGNLHSLRRAMERAGRQVTVTDDPAQLAQADAIVLPGVGAFGAVMDSLEPARHDLVAHVAARKPLLGICIGMQAMYQASDEDPQHAGLGLVPGRVVQLPASAGKIPHMGWNTLHDATELGLGDVGHVYYVHSYAARITPECIATTHYGMDFAAAIRKDKCIGFQFHPEKSGAAGARILTAALDQLETP